MFGYLRDFLRRIGLDKNQSATERNKMKGFVPLYTSFEGFFSRNIFKRAIHGAGKPICSPPTVEVDVLERTSDDENWHFRLTGKKRRCINLASYNYLGFAEKDGPCVHATAQALQQYGVGVCSSRQELGNYNIHEELETTTARFLGMEDAITFGMGFATNSMNIPVLMGGKVGISMQTE
ncbi:serine palmitoyltransferase 2-like [Branchiostoma floridae]|uniref:Serine palmitoyltransferase 2-like n=1 Tax=Branchiostoma floridae TaxID=7739 RepID=A0A9J7N243_BRAFL|nr:serine palmitoyltransferase 2-like [Branchiostoma floridae]